MLKKLRQPNSEGFTIIEIVIVLAIAAFILLIVLLAVPALQRNSRNSAIKNDASAMAGGIADFESNNNGAVATKGTFGTNGFTLANATVNNGATVKLQGSTSVNGATTGSPSFAVTTQPAAANVSAGALYVDTGEGCQTVSGTAPTKSSRAFAIYYWTETPGVTAGADGTTGIINGAGLKGQCLES